MPKRPTIKTKEQLVAENTELRLRLEEAEETLNAIHNGEVDAIIVSGAGGEQVFTLKQAEEALAWEQYLLSSLLDNLPDHIYFKDRDSRFTRLSKSQTEAFGLRDSAEALGKTDFDYFTEEHARPAFEAEKKIMATGQPMLGLEEKETWPDGRLSWAKTTKMPLKDQAGNVIGTFGISSDITERKNAEESLRESELRFRTLINQAPVAILVSRDGLCLYGNQKLLKICVLPGVEELIGRPVFEFFAPQSQQDNKERTRLRSLGLPVSGEFESFLIRTDGSQFPVQVSISQVKLTDGLANIAFITDITERKRSEEALQESEAEYRTLFENSVVGISQALPDGHLIRANKAYAQMYGYADPEEMMADVTHIERLYANPKDREEVLRTLAAKGGMEPREMMVVRRDGTHISVLVGAREVRDSKGKLRFYQAEHVEITERKQAEVRIQRQLEHLQALSTIDRVITSNFDLNLSLSEILVHVTKELGVDAADILILNPGLQMLEFAAEQGFRTNAIRKVHVRLGESHAGRAALERQLVQVPNLKDETECLLPTTLLAGEDFACYYGVPLITKGQVKGVLEIFNRGVLAPDAEWFDFLNTLAGQTAIAIENSTLFENLQRSSSELALAYDATIEGWSHALDLRDEETEGHTQRVTDMTVKLARLIGLSEADLVQVRWGALLHDIGKMGVPDRILLKPGSLTDEEWVVMKKHPRFAYEMLSPIHYLRLALEIPYCHHEKWDGSGYPRGLKGNQIPLVGRIFAVVDVWDALRSDRPYRPAWAEEKVREHIRNSSGTHFDPKAVELFLNMMNE